MGKYCIVHECPHTSCKNPTKRFISVPKTKDRRKAWFKAIKTGGYGDTTSLFVCEDHFNLQDDAENWTKIRFLANERVVIKPGVVPHIFRSETYRTTVKADAARSSGGLVSGPVTEKSFKKDRMSQERTPAVTPNTASSWLTVPLCANICIPGLLSVGSPSVVLPYRQSPPPLVLRRVGTPEEETTIIPQKSGAVQETVKKESDIAVEISSSPTVPLCVNSSTSDLILGLPWNIG